MSFEAAFFSLLFVMIVRECFFMYQIQKLLDKAMSRSHHEYQLAQRAGKAGETKPKIDDDMPEDLGALQGLI